MGMHYAHRYTEHNESLARFAAKFNSIGDKDIQLKINEVENYYDDASFIYGFGDDAVSFKMDWQKRYEHYFRFKGFRFKDLWQWDRKMKKPEIFLSMQCSTDETGLLVAWHEDFSPDKMRKSKTEKNGVEGWEWQLTHITYNFMEYNTNTEEGIIQIKNMIKRAFESRQFNFRAFGET